MGKKAMRYSRAKEFPRKKQSKILSVGANLIFAPPGDRSDLHSLIQIKASGQVLQSLLVRRFNSSESTVALRPLMIDMTHGGCCQNE